MPRGAAPGERRGGRAKGKLNQATLDKAVRAEADVIRHEVSGKKLAKDVLEDYMFAFHAIAAVYQNAIIEALRTGLQPAPSDVEKFKDWGTLVTKTAADLAKYQSPTFRAIAVTMPQPLPKGADGNIIEGTIIKLDQISISKVYRQIVAGDRK